MLHLAEPATENLGNLGLLAQYGPLGIIAALLIWFARGAHQRERDRADLLGEENKRLITIIADREATQRERDHAERLEEDNKRLNAIIADRVIPAVLEAARAAEESARLLANIQSEQQQHRRSVKGGT